MGGRWHALKFDLSAGLLPDGGAGCEIRPMSSLHERISRLDMSVRNPMSPERLHGLDIAFGDSLQPLLRYWWREVGGTTIDLVESGVLVHSAPRWVSTRFEPMVGNEDLAAVARDVAQVGSASRYVPFAVDGAGNWLVAARVGEDASVGFYDHEREVVVLVCERLSALLESILRTLEAGGRVRTVLQTWTTPSDLGAVFHCLALVRTELAVLPAVPAAFDVDTPAGRV